MSKCNNNGNNLDPVSGGNTMAGLIIFILVILQFKQRHNHDEKDHDDPELFDNSVLFILVLFCVACCGKVKLGC
jgi:hypothetical protein